MYADMTALRMKEKLIKSVSKFYGTPGLVLKSESVYFHYILTGKMQANDVYTAKRQ